MKTLEVNVIGCVSENFDVPDELTVLAEGETPNSDQGCFRLLTEKAGDERVVWNRLNIAEINAAEEMFKSLIKKGLTPYKVGTGGKKTSEVMKIFDPLAEEVIFMPIRALVGG